MAYSFLGAVTAENVAQAVTAAVDTTGASLIVAMVGGGTSHDFTDSKSNTWTPLNTVNGEFGGHSTIFYAENPTVGTGHTFTNTETAAAIVVAWFSGAKTSGVFDQQTAGGTSTSSTVQPGSVTPTENSELIITGVGGNQYSDPPTLAVNSGFTIAGNENAVDGNNFAAGMAYLIQTTAAAVNPTWTVDGLGFTVTCNIATFKAAAVGSGGGGGAIGGNFFRQPGVRPYPFSPGNAR